MSEFQAADHYFDGGDGGASTPLVPVYKDELEAGLAELSEGQRKWLSLNGFKGAAGQVGLVPGEGGALEVVVFGLGKKDEPVIYHPAGGLAGKLPDGDYHFTGALAGDFDAALAFGLGAYRYDACKSAGKSPGAEDGDEEEGDENAGEKGDRTRLRLDDGIDRAALSNILTAQYFGRDLINTPANILGPNHYEEVIEEFADKAGASFKVVRGEALLAENFPMIHAVGRASDQAPRLVELNWGDDANPKITLVGKGICFDTGGLNLKPGNAMNLMKKDMGGSATALTIASMVMGAKLPVRLRVLLPIAENNISANAFRPGDVLTSRKGITVEIDNTDAEGRLVLADALALADEEAVEAIFCFATLTGAARVAVGPDLPPFYTTDETMAAAIGDSAVKVRDYLWRMPFWSPYDKWLSSKIADVNHVSSGPFAGSITAALFLKRFVEAAPVFSHFDIYGWTPTALPGKPYGGEPQAARAVFDYLAKTYGAQGDA